MKHRCPLACGLALTLVGSLVGEPAPSREEVRTALRRATAYLSSLATEGGYLWRYSEDLAERYGENRASPTQVWVQPPGTPSVGLALIEAYRATGDSCHLDAATAAARALVRGQLESGGWSYLIEFDPAERRRWAYRVDAGTNGSGPERGRNVTTFDDDNTQSAVRFLLAYVGVARGTTEETHRIRETLDFALSKMREAQYPNGAWPQRYDGRPHNPAEHPVCPAVLPTDWSRFWPKNDYGRYYTLNDQTQSDCIRTLLAAWRVLDDDRWLESARRGGEFLLLAQLPEPQPAWAQQYNFRMEPAWARAFEPPAVCSNESAGAMRTLIDLYLATGETRFLEPGASFVAWLRRSRIGPDRWARYYELGTNRPIYGDRDGRVHYRLAEISEERRRGYSWEGSYGIPALIRTWEMLQEKGREDLLAREAAREPGKPSAERVRRILAAQDARGAWLEEGWIQMRTCVTHLEDLAAYLREP